MPTGIFRTSSTVVVALIVLMACATIGLPIEQDETQRIPISMIGRVAHSPGLTDPANKRFEVRVIGLDGMSYSIADWASWSGMKDGQRVQLSGELVRTEVVVYPSYWERFVLRLDPKAPKHRQFKEEWVSSAVIEPAP